MAKSKKVSIRMDEGFVKGYERLMLFRQSIEHNALILLAVAHPEARVKRVQRHLVLEYAGLKLNITLILANILDTVQNMKSMEDAEKTYNQMAKKAGL